MFSYHNRQYIFRRSDGELWSFYCDSGQNICCATQNKYGSWSAATVLIKNAYPYFYADMDQDDMFHILYQDNSGNIHYARVDRQAAGSVPILNSRSPAAYNKQLFIAPFKNNIYFFYVLQHENSFILAYQLLSGGKLSNPRVVDYVSGSSLPCAFAYDTAKNIYVFYQSYDGKFLQLGYKKYNAVQKSWSEYTPVTKYAGSCEYPHVLIDDSGIIHLCYQRRAPKFFEMAYQQKAPDKNLWSPEEIVHSSVHSFDNASILRENGNIIVYWVRDDIIYYSSSPEAGNNWSKPTRLNFPAGRQLRCVCFKSNVPRKNQEISHGPEISAIGDVPAKRAASELPPAVYPGTVSNGLRLAFGSNESIPDISRLFGDSAETLRPYAMSRGTNGLSSANSQEDIRSLLLDAFRQLQSRLEETAEGSSAVKEELAKLINEYEHLSVELGKCVVRLQMLENRLEQLKKLSNKVDELSHNVRMLTDGKNCDATPVQNASEPDRPGPEAAPQHAQIESQSPQATGHSSQTHQENKEPKKIPLSSLGPEALKQWEEWQEPEEWRNG